MRKRNSIIFIFLCIIFALSLAVVFPLDKGLLLNRGVKLGLDLQGGVHLVYQADLANVTDTDASVEGAMAILANRVNPMGVSEPVIQRQGTDRIVVELPGTTITDAEKERLSQVDILEFGELVTDNSTFKWEDEYGKWKPATAEINGETKTLSSRYFKNNTIVGRTSTSAGVYLSFEWTDEGAQLSKIITTRLVGQPLGIFAGDEPLRTADGTPIAPTVIEAITDRGQITGLSPLKATELSQLLNQKP